MKDFSKLESWEEIVSVGAELRQGRDECSWDLGDLVIEACRRKTSRPSAFEAIPTVSALAKAIGEERPVLSNLANNSQFYTAHMRNRIPLEISWRQAAAARKKSGWIPGTPIMPAQRRKAMSILFRTADNAPRGLQKPAPDLLSRVEDAFNVTQRALKNVDSTNPKLKIVSAELMGASQRIENARTLLAQMQHKKVEKTKQPNKAKQGQKVSHAK